MASLVVEEPLRDFPEMRRCCPAFWETYTEVRDAVDRLIGEHGKSEEDLRDQDITLKPEWLLAPGRLIEVAEVFDDWVMDKEHEGLSFEYKRYVGGWLAALVAGLQDRYPDAGKKALHRLKAGDFPGVVSWRYGEAPGVLIEALRQRGERIHSAIVEELIPMIRERWEWRELSLALARICLHQGTRVQSAQLVDLALEGIEEGFSKAGSIFWDWGFTGELLELIDDAQELVPDLAWKALEKASLFPGQASFSVGVAGRLCRWGRMKNGLALFRRILKGKCPKPKNIGIGLSTEESQSMTMRAWAAGELWEIGRKAWAKKVIVPLCCELERLWEEGQGLDLQGVYQVEATVGHLRSPLLAASNALAAMGDQEAAGELRCRAKELEELVEREEQALARSFVPPAQVGTGTAEWYLRRADALQSGDACEADRLSEEIRDRQGPDWIPVKLKLLKVKLADPEEYRRQLAGLLRLPGGDDLTVVDATLSELIRLCEDPQILLKIFESSSWSWPPREHET